MGDFNIDLNKTGGIDFGKLEEFRSFQSHKYWLKEYMLH